MQKNWNGGKLALKTAGMKNVQQVFCAGLLRAFNLDSGSSRSGPLNRDFHHHPPSLSNHLHKVSQGTNVPKNNLWGTLDPFIPQEMGRKLNPRVLGCDRLWCSKILVNVQKGMPKTDLPCGDLKIDLMWFGTGSFWGPDNLLVREAKVLSWSNAWGPPSLAHVDSQSLFGRIPQGSCPVTLPWPPCRNVGTGLCAARSQCLLCWRGALQAR